MEDQERLTEALADRYRIEREIGSGGMATVYLAEDLKHHRQVAVKVLDPDLARSLGAERFLREIETAANLTHPHILPLFDSGEADGFLFYVMPYVKGESLRTRLTKEKQLAAEDAIQITREVADALAYAHREGVIHRDVKPANIMLEEGHAVLADFGVAHAVSEAKEDRLTRTGTSLGTPSYMSPEQATGEQDLDGRSDQYALGCVLFEMLAGHPPFVGVQADAVIRQHITEEPPLITRTRPSVAEEVANVINRSLAKSPADRFKDTGDMAAALALTTAPVLRDPKPFSRPGGIVLGFFLLVVVSGGVLWMLRGQEPEDPMVAVLPLANLSGLEEDVYFTDGMHGQILTQLSKIASLGVISSTSVQEYRASPKNLRSIGEELGARYIAEGDVLRVGDEVRINIQLIDAVRDRHLWAETYDRPLSVENLLSIQTEIAQAIAGALHAVLTPEEERELQRLPTDNLDAYDFYLRGRDYYRANRTGYSEQSYRNSLQMFERAVELDPGFALAHAWVGRVHIRRVYLRYGVREEQLGLGREAVDRALDLAPDLPDAHLALAQYYRYLPDHDRFLREVAIVEQALPGDATVLGHKASALWALERWDEAVSTRSRAAAIDPRATGIIWILGRWLIELHRFDEAEEYINRTLELQPDNFNARGDSADILWSRDGDPELWRRWAMDPDLPRVLWVESMRWVRFLLARDYEAALEVLRTRDVEYEGWWPHFPKPLREGITHRFAGEPELARAAFDSARVVLEERAQEQPDDPTVHRALGLAYAGLGMTELAIQEGLLVVDLLPGFQKGEMGIGYDIWGLAWIYSLLGDANGAIEHLETLLAHPIGPTVNRIRSDPWFDDLRAHPRFQALLEEYRDDMEP